VIGFGAVTQLVTALAPLALATTELVKALRSSAKAATSRTVRAGTDRAENTQRRAIQLCPGRGAPQENIDPHPIRAPHPNTRPNRRSGPRKERIVSATPCQPEAVETQPQR
jgi:hypothetical protein